MAPSPPRPSVSPLRACPAASPPCNPIPCPLPPHCKTLPLATSGTLSPLARVPGVPASPPAPSSLQVLSAQQPGLACVSGGLSLPSHPQSSRDPSPSVPLPHRTAPEPWGGHLHTGLSARGVGREQVPDPHFWGPGRWHSNSCCARWGSLPASCSHTRSPRTRVRGGRRTPGSEEAGDLRVSPLGLARAGPGGFTGSVPEGAGSAPQQPWFCPAQGAEGKPLPPGFRAPIWGRRSLPLIPLMHSACLAPCLHPTLPGDTAESPGPST